MICSSSVKNTIGSLIGIAVNLLVAVDSILIFTILILPTHEHGIFLHFKPRNTYRLKVRGWKKIFHANGEQKKARAAVLMPDKIDFKIKTVKTYFIMIM